MDKYFRYFALALLSINGLSALTGGWLFITDPSGGKLQIPVSWLLQSPFENYLVPGIILFITNGLFSLVVVAIILFRWKIYPQAILFQGCILTGWILIQMIMLQTVHPLHLVLGGVGALLMLLGYILVPVEQIKR